MERVPVHKNDRQTIQERATRGIGAPLLDRPLSVQEGEEGMRSRGVRSMSQGFSVQEHAVAAGNTQGEAGDFRARNQLSCMTRADLTHLSARCG